MTRRHLLTLALLAAVGCAPKATVPAAVDITGRLSAAGKPFGNVVLTFHPQDAAAQGQQPTTMAKANGTFAVRCLPGTYKVTITPLPRAAGDGGPAAASGPGGPRDVPPGVLAAYATAANTPWTIRVNEGSNPEFTHTLVR